MEIVLILQHCFQASVVSVGLVKVRLLPKRFFSDSPVRCCLGPMMRVLGVVGEYRRIRSKKTRLFRHGFSYLFRSFLRSKACFVQCPFFFFTDSCAKVSIDFAAREEGSRVQCLSVVCWIGHGVHWHE